MESDLYIEVDQLIPLVEQRPVLWDKSLEDHKSRNLTLLAWRQVCCALFPDFPSLTDKQKNEYCRLVLRKWTNIKDSYVKAEKKKLEKHKPGVRTKPSRRYIYEKELAFLKANLTTTVNVSKSTPRVTEKHDTDIKPIIVSVSPSAISPVQPATPSKRIRVEKVGQTTPNTSESQENRHISFLRSIIPSLDRLSEEQVVEFQMGVLSVLQSVRAGRRFSEPYHMTGVCSHQVSVPLGHPVTQNSSPGQGSSSKVIEIDQSQQVIIPGLSDSPLSEDTKDF